MADNEGEEIVFGQDEVTCNERGDEQAVEDAAKADNASAGMDEIEKDTREDGAEAAKSDDSQSETYDEASCAKELEETKNRYLYLYAEYDNYRKRTQKEKDNLYSDAVAQVAGEFLGVIDNIDRALSACKEADTPSDDKIYQGIEMVSKQAVEILNKIGVEEIAVERGTRFDPNFHEAGMHIEESDLGEQEVAQVFAKGYQYKDRVIRHAVVQVAN